MYSSTVVPDSDAIRVPQNPFGAQSDVVGNTSLIEFSKVWRE